MLSLFVYSCFNDFYHRDNAKFCSCGGDRQVYYWDVSTGRVIRKFRGHDGEVDVSKTWNPNLLGFSFLIFITHFFFVNEQ